MKKGGSEGARLKSFRCAIWKSVAASERGVDSETKRRCDASEGGGDIAPERERPFRLCVFSKERLSLSMTHAPAARASPAVSAAAP